MRMLKIESLPTAKQWIDRDHIMLHACFQILKDCVEKEEVDNHSNYETYKDIIDEIRFLYQWWEKRKGDEEFDDTKIDDEMLNRLMKIRTFLWT